MRYIRYICYKISVTNVTNVTDNQKFVSTSGTKKKDRSVKNDELEEEIHLVI